MPTALPAGHRLRRPTREDAAAIADLVEAHDPATVDEPGAALDEVLEVMDKPGHDPSADAWLAVDAGDAAVAWGYLDRAGEERLRVAVAVRPESAETVAPALVEALLNRAAELAHARGATGVRVGASVPHGAAGLLSVYTAAGFGLERYVGRMRYALRGDERAPEPPEGVELKVFAELPDREDAARVHHRIMRSGLAGLGDGRSADFATWWEGAGGGASAPYDEWRVAYVDGEPAGVLQTGNAGAADNGGWIRNLVVAPEYRGRGLGRLLLATAFAVFAAKGRDWVGVTVDTGDAERAFAIYAQAGMRPAYMIDVLSAWITARETG